MDKFFNYTTVPIIIFITIPIIVIFISEFKSSEIIKSIRIPGTLLIVLGDLIVLIIATIISTILKNDIDSTLKGIIYYSIIPILLYIAPVKIIAEFHEENKTYKLNLASTNSAFAIFFAWGSPCIKCDIIYCIYLEWLGNGMEEKIPYIEKNDIIFIIINFVMCIIVDVGMKKI